MDSGKALLLLYSCCNSIQSPNRDEPNTTNSSFKVFAVPTAAVVWENTEYSRAVAFSLKFKHLFECGEIANSSNPIELNITVCKHFRTQAT